MFGAIVLYYYERLATNQVWGSLDSVKTLLQILTHLIALSASTCSFLVFIAKRDGLQETYPHRQPTILMKNFPAMALVNS